MLGIAPARIPAPTAIPALAELLGVPASASRCVLSAAQLVTLGELLLRLRPHDPQAACYLGGLLCDVAARDRPGVPPAVSLHNDLGAAPFLVIAGKQGALALLTAEHPNGFRVSIASDPDTVDRAVLVLAQLGGHAYSLASLAAPEPQRAFMASVIAGLVREPALADADIAALLPRETRWIELGRALAAVVESHTCLQPPEVRQLVLSCGGGRALVGQFDADQRQLFVVAAEGASAPRMIDVQGWGVGAAIAVLSPPQVGGTHGAWFGSGVVVAVPLARSGQVWGLLLTVHERAPTSTARANLNGLGALLVATLSAAPLVAPAPAPAPSAAGRLGMLATNLPPAPANAAVASPSSPTPPATSVRETSIARAEPSRGNGRAAPPDRSAVVGLLAKIRDHALLVDAQGRLVAWSDSASALFALTEQARGSYLVDVVAALGQHLAAALLDDDQLPPVTLPDGRAADVLIQPWGNAWLFLLHPSLAAPSAAALPQPKPAITVTEEERIDRFMTSLSNGIRSPLRTLRDLIGQVPAAGPLNEQQSRVIGQVVKLNSELMLLMNDLFALGQMRLQSPESKVSLRIDLLVEAAVGTQYAEFGRRGQQVHSDIPLDLPQVPGYEEGLWRAVTVLIDNAIKYSPAGAKIAISVAQAPHELTVSVRDTGPGLPPDELDQVFDPFYRAPSIEQLGVVGRGLGLTIAKAVIEQHGGRLWASSAVGQGSTFSFSLPF